MPKKVKRSNKKLRGLGLNKFGVIKKFKSRDRRGNLKGVTSIEVKQNIFPDAIITLHPTKGYRKTKR